MEILNARIERTSLYEEQFNTPSFSIIVEMGIGHQGFGVMDDDHNIVCYKTFEEATQRAEYWLTKIGVDKDLATALCTWSTGQVQPNCFYYQNFLSL